MKTIITKMSIIGLIVLMMASCKKDMEMPSGKFVNIKTNEVTEITAFSAVVSAYVGADCDERGVCWSRSSNPTVSDSHTTDGSGMGSFTSSITGLWTNTTYYVRAYATDSKGTSYGEQKIFITSRVSVPTVTTSSVSNITRFTATCGGNVTSDGGATVTARGVCWSTSPNPLISNSHTTNGSGTGSFTSSTTELWANTTYYIRAYATNSSGTGYGEQKSFTTLSGGGGEINGHAYVDLGLPSGTLWATCNVGASSPEDYGWYFAWGETTTKSTYDLSAYKWWNGSETTFTKYCTSDNKRVLELADDAARANWGGAWRMPTYDEMHELTDCTWTWTTQDGKNGYRVTGSTGTSIFLPAAGYKSYDGGPSLAGSLGSYWSSSLRTVDPFYAYDLYFNSGNVYTDYDDRYFGQSVRPVCPFQK